MTSSMTAFSRRQQQYDWGSLTWEIRSVNHRYLETGIRLPETYRGLEAAVRDALRKSLSRGKVDCQLRFQADEGQQTELNIDAGLVSKLVNAEATVRSIAGQAERLTTAEILRWPGVLKEAEEELDVREKQAIDLFHLALEDLMEARRREGEALESLLRQRIATIGEIVASIRERLPEILSRQRDNLITRLSDLKVELDPERFEQEVVVLAQKADVDEELDRLAAHLKEVDRVLGMSGQKGRRLDFLMQELNREANTLSSKSFVSETTLHAVELKVLIEQMREQIQNIE
ncbi:MAG: YicC/YloC family endoribonuclease [Pseudohongiellaceae bacterium]